MKKNEASFTAEISLLYRAVESLKPKYSRVLSDQYAKVFLRSPVQWILKNRYAAEFALWFCIERRFPGAIGTHLARVRLIDEVLEKSIKEGVQQVVILGAGYDTRACRFVKDHENITVFEVDHPKTQQEKKERVKSVWGSLFNHITYVPVDFLKDRLEHALFKSGYIKTLKTLFIWEGVSFYLTQTAVDDVLSFISQNSGVKSAIVFDYMKASFIKGENLTVFEKKVRSWHQKKEEPLTFGIEEEDITSFLYQRGFSEVNNISNRSLKKDYFKGKAQNHSIYPFWRIAHVVH